jgi:hypothetical protein
MWYSRGVDDNKLRELLEAAGIVNTADRASLPQVAALLRAAYGAGYLAALNDRDPDVEDAVRNYLAAWSKLPT